MNPVISGESGEYSKRMVCMQGNETGRLVTLGLIQTEMSEDTATNMERALAKTREAAEKGAQIVCLPELYRTRYFPQEEKGEFTHLSESVPGESTDLLCEAARDLGIVMIVPIYENGPANTFFNSAVVIDNRGRLLPTYRKNHIPFDPLFYEKNYFAAGDTGFHVYHTEYASFSVLICYDQWFPEAARICTLRGADLLFYPTAIGWIKDQPSPDQDWPHAWETIQCSHAIANGIHVAAVNRVGTEGRLGFWGRSFVCDAFGRVLERASDREEATLVVTVDLSMNERIQQGWGFLENRRPEIYGDLCGPR